MKPALTTCEFLLTTFVGVDNLVHISPSSPQFFHKLSTRYQQLKGVINSTSRSPRHILPIPLIEEVAESKVVCCS